MKLVKNTYPNSSTILEYTTIYARSQEFMHPRGLAPNKYKLVAIYAYHDQFTENMKL
jgi:hypothetical protein